LNKPYIVEQLFYIYGYYLLIKECTFSIPEEHLKTNELYRKILEENSLFLDLLRLYKEMENLYTYSNPISESSLMLQNQKVDLLLEYFGVEHSKNEKVLFP